MSTKHAGTVLLSIAAGLIAGAGGLYVAQSQGLLTDPAHRSDNAGQTAADHDDDHAGEEPGEHDEHGDHDEHEEGVVHLSNEKLAALDITTVAVKRGLLTSTIDVPGEVQWNSDNLVHVTPRVAGIVASVEKTLGDRVQVGDLLCVLDSREMGDAKMEYLADMSRFEVAQADFERAAIVFKNTKKLLAILETEPTPDQALAQAHDLPVGDNKNQLLTAYTRMKVNKRNFERFEKLLASQIASEADYLEAQGAFEIARADYLSTREEITFNLKLTFLRAEKDFKVAETEMRNSERGLHILGLTNVETAEVLNLAGKIDTGISRAVLYSSIDGVIIDRHLTRGELVSTDTRLYTIADPSHVWIMGRAYERDVRFLKTQQKATVRLDAFPGEAFDGVVDYIGSQLDPDTRTVQVRVVLANPQGRFRAGMFGRVTVFIENNTSASSRNGLLVPMDAIQRVKDGFVVFRLAGAGQFQQIPVRVLAESREYAEVTAQLEAGDKLAVGDTFVLKSEVGKGEMGGGHSH
ncbi:MAG: efflux RND transporter periplasmic adaptor subunit [Phycisphaerae bacterium]